MKFARFILLSVLLALPARAGELTLYTTNISMPAGRTFQMPLTGNDPSNGPLKFAVVSILPKGALTATFSPSTNRSLLLNVTGISGDFTNATALQFDGQQNHVRIPSTNAFYQTPFTAECWTKISGGGTNSACILATYTDQASGWAIYDDGGAFGIELVSTDQGALSAVSSISSRDNAWHHLAVVVEATNATLYVDGTAEALLTYSGSIVNSNNDLLVGNRPALDQPLAGIVDEVRFSSVARDIALECPSGNCSTNLSSDADTVGYWRFNEGSGTTATNSTGNGLDGLLENSWGWWGYPPPNWVAGLGAPLTPFTGNIVLQLFEDLTPKTTARIIQLVQTNFYNGRLFQRVIQDFMCQGGATNTDGSGSIGTTFDDELVPTLTFTGFGHLAMANAGPDSNDSQFFITDADLSVTDTNKPPPRHLDFRHTIFGQVTRGFDVLTKIMSTPVTYGYFVTTNSVQHWQNSGENSTPLSNIVISTATILTNRQDAVLRLAAPATFTGLVTVTVSATSTNKQTTQETFTVNVVSNTVNDPPILSPIPHSMIITQGQAASLPLVVQQLDNDFLQMAWYDTDTYASPPQGWSYGFSQSGLFWIWPNTTVTGTVNMAFGVTDYFVTGGVTNWPHFTINSWGQTNTTYFTHNFSVTVVPRSDTPTMNIVLKSGQLLYSTNSLGCQLKLTGSLVFTNPSDHAFTAADTITISLGDPSNPYIHTFLPTMSNRTAKKGALAIKASISDYPIISAKFDSAKGSFKIQMGRFSLPFAPTNQVQVVLTIGNDYGTNVSTWIQTKPNIFQPPRLP